MKKRIISAILACVLLCSNPVYADYEAVENAQLSEEVIEEIQEAESCPEELEAGEDESIDSETISEWIEETEVLSETESEAAEDLRPETEEEVSETESEAIELMEEVPEELGLKLNDEGALQPAFFAAGDAPELMAVSASQSRLQTLIIAALNSGASQCDISSLNLSKSTDTFNVISAALSNIINSSLDYFYVKNYSYVSLNGVVKKIIFKYKDNYLKADKTLNTELVAIHKSQMNAAILDALSYVKPGMSDVEKALVLHDWIASHCMYDYTYSSEGYTAYGMLVNGLAVCQGYSSAYSGLLQRVGISSYFCPSDSMGHAWTMVYLNGAYYHVDVTWDDPSFTNITYYGLASSDDSDDGFVSHKYFLKSDAEFRKSHTAWETQYVPAASASSTFANYCFFGRDMEFCYADGYWYYMEDGPSKVLYKSKIDGSSKSSVAMSVSMDYLHSYKDKIYFSNRTNGVYEFDPATGKTSQYWSIAPTYTGCRISEFSLEQQAMYVNILGSGRNEKVKIMKAEAVPTSLAVTVLPDKTQFLVGEAFSTDGMKLLLTYSDLSTKTITSGFTTSGFDSATPGTKTVTVTYDGMSTRYAITVANSYDSLDGAVVTMSADSYEYTGKVIKPTVTVKLGAQTLTENTHYIVQYSNNTELGTATAKIIGKGNYLGTLTKTFKILPGTVTEVTAAPAGKNKVALTWKAVYKAAGYYIYRKTGNGSYSYIGMTTTALKYTDTKAIDSGLNYYVVYAYMNNAAGSKVMSVASKAASAKGVVPMVNNLRAIGQVGGVRLTWDKQPEAVGYLVYGIRGSNPYGYVGMTTTGTTFTDKKALKTDWNFYWVFPYHKDASGKMIPGGTPKYVYGKAR